MSKKAYNILFTVILLLQIIGLIYWGTQKEGYHLDEKSSYVYTSTFSKGTMVSNPDVKFLNNWLDSSYFEEYFTVDRTEAFHYIKSAIRMRISCHPPAYYVLLFTVNSFIHSFTKWAGIGINIFLFAIEQIFLLKLVKKISGSEVASLVTVAIYGFSVEAASMTVFIRMYMLLTMATTIFLYVQWLFFENPDCVLEKKSKKKWFFILFLTNVLGTLSHYFYCLIAFLVCAFVCLYLVVNKKYKILFRYGAAELSGVLICFLLWPFMLSDFFGSRGTKTASLLVQVYESHYSDHLKTYYSILSQNSFGGYLTWIIGAMLVASLAVLISKLRRKESVTGLGTLFKNEEYRKGYFEIALAISVFCSVLFVAKCTQYRSSRYFCNLFPALAFIVVIFWNNVFGKMKKKNIYMAVCYALLIGMTFMGYKNTEVEFLFRGTQEKLDIARSYSDLPIVYVFEDDTEDSSINKKQHVQNDCFYFLFGQDCYFTYFADCADGIDDLDYTDKYLLYVVSSKDKLEDIVDYVGEYSKAVSVEKLYDTGNSVAYLVDKGL